MGFLMIDYYIKRFVSLIETGEEFLSEASQCTKDGTGYKRAIALCHNAYVYFVDAEAVARSIEYKNGIKEAIEGKERSLSYLEELKAPNTNENRNEIANYDSKKKTPEHSIELVADIKEISNRYGSKSNNDNKIKSNDKQRDWLG